MPRNPTLTRLQYEVLKVFVKHSHSQKLNRRPRTGDIRKVAGGKTKAGVHNGFILRLAARGYLDRDKEDYAHRGWFITKLGRKAYRESQWRQDDVKAEQSRPRPIRDRKRHRLSQAAAEAEAIKHAQEFCHLPAELLLRAQAKRNFRPGVERLVLKIQSALPESEKRDDEGAQKVREYHRAAERSGRLPQRRPRDTGRLGVLVEDPPGTEWWRLVCPIHLWTDQGQHGEASSPEQRGPDVADFTALLGY